MSNDLEDRLDRLEKQVARLEYRDSQILSALLDNKDPLTMFTLENDLSAEQVKGITEVMEHAYNTLGGDTPIDERDFEKRLLPYIPEKERPGGQTYSFIQCLLITFTKSSRWAEVCEHFQTTYNVPDRSMLP